MKAEAGRPEPLPGQAVKPIVHIKEGLWGNLACIAFCLGLAGFCVWLDHHSHGEVSVFVWVFASIFVLCCWIPIDSIRKPSFRLLAIDGQHLLWRIYNGNTGKVTSEQRVPLRSITALKWVVPKPADSRKGRDYANARLLLITVHRSSQTLPSEFFPAVYRRKIEKALKEAIPSIQITEKLECPD